MSGVIVLIIRILIVVSLYAFLGLAVYTIWRELSLAGAQLGPQQVPEITVIYNDTDDASRTFQVSEITIGRESACTLVIPDDTVSAYHARLRYHHKQWWIDDLQSTNGTFINDERVFTSTVILSGDEITLGKVKLQILVKSL